MRNPFVRELYKEETLGTALGRLEALPQAGEDIDKLFAHAGIEKGILKRTAQKGMEEYVDGLVDLRHGWKPKMMDGKPEEKEELYGDLAATIGRMDAFSEPYVSAMRLVSAAALRQLAAITHSPVVEEALNYKGARYDFDEQNVVVTTRDGESPATTERKKSLSATDAYSQLSRGYMHLKDLLNLLEDATTSEVYENVRNTNGFPEARIGKCFEAAHEVDKTTKQLRKAYRFLLRNADLSETDKRQISKTLKLFEDLDKSWFIRATQWYAHLQFNEKPWDISYKASIASLGATVAGSAYSLAGGTNEGLLFFAGAPWGIASGVAVYFTTDLGPKTAKFVRQLDEKVMRYKWV